MKITRLAAALILASCASLKAGTLTVAGELPRFTFSIEANEVILIVPMNADHLVTPDNIAGFTAGGANEPQQLRYRARFTRTPRIQMVNNTWVFSDEAVASAPPPAVAPAAVPVPGVRPPSPPPAAPAASIAANPGSSAAAGPKPAREWPSSGTRGAKTPEDQSKTPGESEATKPPSGKIGNAIVQLPAEGTLQKRKFSASTAVPESPAAAIIGSTATVVRFNDAGDATTQLINLVDRDGNLRSGFSFAFRPYRVLVKPTLTDYAYGPGPDAVKEDEKRGRLVRFMSRLDLSLAATVDEAKGTSKRGASLALGLSGYLFNNADSRLHLARALVEDFKNPKTPPVFINRPPRGGREGVTVAQETAAPRVQEVTERVFAEVWNNSYWAFGGAPRLRSATGNTGDFNYDGGAAWTTLAWGFEGAKDKLHLDFLEDKSQLILHTSYRDRQQVTDPTDATKKIREDAWVSAAQLRIGGNNLNVFAEYLREAHKPVGRKKYTSRTYFAGFEKRLATDLWLQVSVGSEKNQETNDTSALVRTALNYAFGNSITPAPADGP